MNGSIRLHEGNVINPSYIVFAILALAVGATVLFASMRVLRHRHASADRTEIAYAITGVTIAVSLSLVFWGWIATSMSNGARNVSSILSGYGLSEVSVAPDQCRSFGGNDCLNALMDGRSGAQQVVIKARKSGTMQEFTLKTDDSGRLKVYQGTADEALTATQPIQPIGYRK